MTKQQAFRPNTGAGAEGEVVGETVHLDHEARVVGLKRLHRLKLIELDHEESLTTAQERLSCEAQAWKLLGGSVQRTRKSWFGKLVEKVVGL